MVCRDSGAENKKAAAGLPHSKCKYIQEKNIPKRIICPEKRMLDGHPSDSVRLLTGHYCFLVSKEE
jgi:hypothetical protein